VALDHGELFGHPEGLARRQYGHLGDGVGVVGVGRHEGVARLVHRHRVLLLGDQDVRALPPAQNDAIPGLVEIGGRDDLAIRPHGHNGRLVDQVGQVRS
jgi:hypothetical protein